MRNLLAGKRIDIMKWLGWIVVLILITGVIIYGVTIRKQIWFTITAPEAVNACLEGYRGEHSEADRRFNLKQHSELLSPLPDEDLKGKSQ